MPDEELRKIFMDNLNKYMELSDRTQADLHCCATQYRMSVLVC